MFHCSVIKDRFCIAVCLKQLCYYIMSFPACQELFSTFLKLFSLLSCSNFGSISCLPLSCQELFSRNFSVFTERRRRDLNPRAATNDLLPFQGSPFGQLGYFSTVARIAFILYYHMIFSCNERRGWDSNPRALADKRFSRPPRYDHFDISPYVVDCVCCVLTADASDILASIPASVNNFFTFFSIFIFIFPDFP